MVEGGVYENPELYEGKPFTSDDIGDFFGYVYLITNKTTGKKYIGRKYFVQKRESLREERERLRANPIGKSITDPPQNSKPTYPSSEREISPERSYPYIEPLERQTMRRQDNFF